ncbi:MAG: helix-turn-helix transcriptional regulator [Thermoplasmata archaeon]
MAREPRKYDELQEQVRELSAKMESLEEALSRVAAPYSQLLEYIERFQKISSSYFRMLGLYQRFGAISPDLLIPGVKDPISRDIVKVLFERDGQNISQITERLKTMRGTSSRRIVRGRLKYLEEIGVVRSRRSAKSKDYWLTEEYIEKWYDLLGLSLASEREKAGR